VVWCGVVWCGVVWCGVVWCGVVWCGVVWCGVETLVVAQSIYCRAASCGVKVVMNSVKGWCDDYVCMKRPHWWTQMFMWVQLAVRHPEPGLQPNPAAISGTCRTCVTRYCVAGARG
jgi:hypothetical protein